MAFSCNGTYSKVSLIGNELSVGGMIGDKRMNGKVQLNFNARVASDPDTLRKAIRETVDSVLKKNNVSDYRMTFDDCFSPGRPNPTYRVM